MTPFPSFDEWLAAIEREHQALQRDRDATAAAVTELDALIARVRAIAEVP